MLDEYIKLDEAIMGLDGLINEAATGTMARTLFEAKDTIYNQQRYVIDVRPVRVGKWEEVAEYGGWGDTYFRCSVCGEEWYIDTGTPIENGMKYCPSCGARMDGDTNE